MNAIPAQSSTDASGGTVVTYLTDPEYATLNVGPTFLSFGLSDSAQVYENRFDRVGRHGLPKEPSISDALPPAIAANWSRLALSGIGTVLYTRLVNLAKRQDGWRGSGSRALDGSSLRTFLFFWKLIRGNAVEPQVVLAPNGNLQAIWQRNAKRTLDLEFTESTDIYFGLLDGSSVQEGVDTASELAKVLLNRSNEPLKWR